jgi:membrane-associated protein
MNGLAIVAGWFGDLGNWIGSLVDHIDEAAGNWWFLAVVVAVALADSIVPVAPSETVVIVAGVAIATGTAPYPLWLLILVAAGGAFVGDNIAYGIGRLFGGRVQRRADRKPTFAHKLDVARDQIRQRGGLLLITARFLPGGRTLVTLTCGVTRQPHRWFMGWDLLATLIWATYGAGLAFIVGRPLQDHHALAFLAAFAAAVAVNIVIEVVRRVRHRDQVPDATGDVADEPVGDAR